MIDIDGSYYEGEWSSNNKNGSGIYILADSSIYEGEWRNNLPHGKGL